MCGLLLGPVFGALVFPVGGIGLLSPHEEGEHFRDEVLVAREDHSVVCIGIKLSLALGRRLAGLYGVPLGQGTGRIRHTQRYVLCAPMARLPPTRPHAHTPARSMASLLRRGAVESRVRPVAGNALRHGLGGCRTSGPGAPGSVHPSAARHAVVESSPVPCGQSPRVLRPQAHRLPSPPAGC